MQSLESGSGVVVFSVGWSLVVGDQREDVQSGGGGSTREEIIIMGRKGHAGYSICSHHLVKDTGEKGRYGPTTRMKHRKSSTPAMWRKSTIKVSPCDICASNDAAVRAKHWRAKGRSFSPWELLEACKKVIGSYDRRAAPGETPDAYADVFLPLYNVVHPYDIIFVKQVLLPYHDPSFLSLHENVVLLTQKASAHDIFVK